MYADNVGLLHNGKLLCFGTPSQVMNDKILSEAYSCKIKVNKTPKNDKIFIGTFFLKMVSGADSRNTGSYNQNIKMVGHKN